MIKTQLTIEKIALKLKKQLKERYNLILIDNKINDFTIEIFELTSLDFQSDSIFCSKLTVEHISNNIKRLLKKKYNHKVNFLNARELLSNILGFKNANTMVAIIKEFKIGQSNIQPENGMSNILGFKNSNTSFATVKESCLSAFNIFKVGQYVMSRLHPEKGIGRLINNFGIIEVDFGFGVISELPRSDIMDIDCNLIDVNPSLKNSVTAIVNTDDGSGLSCEFDIRNYLKFLSHKDLNTLLDNNSYSEESDKVYEFFSSLGFLEIIDLHLEHKNKEETLVGFSVSIEHKSLDYFISNLA